MTGSDRVEISGSHRKLVSDHSRIGDIDPTEEIAVTVYLRPRADTGWVDQEAHLAPSPGPRPAMQREVKPEDNGLRRGEDSARGPDSSSAQ